MSSNEEEEQSNEPDQLFDDLGFPLLTPEEQVQADVLDGPFLFGTRVYSLFKQTYYPDVVIGHSFDYSEYKVKCIGNGEEFRRSPNAIIPMSSLQVGDKVEIFDEIIKKLVPAQLTFVPSKNTPREWFAGRFKIKQEGNNEEIDFDWHNLHISRKQDVFYKKRFTCKSVYPNESSTPCLRRQRNSSTIQTQLLSSSRKSNRKSKNNEPKPNSTVSNNEMPIRKDTTVKEESPSRSTIFLGDSDEDLSSQHPEFFMENQPETSNQVEQGSTQVRQGSTHSNSNSVSNTSALKNCERSRKSVDLKTASNKRKDINRHKLLGYPTLTSEEQVQVDTLNGPFSIGSRVFMLLEHTYFPSIIIEHEPDYSEYKIKCLDNDKEYWRKYVVNNKSFPSFFPISCLKFGDSVFVPEGDIFKYSTILNVPSKNNADEWAKGMFKCKQKTNNRPVLLNWKKFYIEKEKGPMYNERFTCESEYPNRGSAILPPKNSSNQSSVFVEAPSSETPAKRPRKETIKEESLFRNKVSLHDNEINEDLLSQHQPMPSNQVRQGSTHSNSNSLSTNVSGIDEIGRKYLELKEAGDLDPCKLDFGSKEIEIPKCFLVARSNVFAQFISSNGNVIKIEGCKPEAIDAFVKYLYCCNSDDLGDFAPDLILLAEKYEIDGLKGDCLKSFVLSITNENLFDKIKLIPECAELKQLVLDFIKNKASKDAILELIFTSKWYKFAANNDELAQEISKELRKKI